MGLLLHNQRHSYAIFWAWEYVLDSWIYNEVELQLTDYLKQCVIQHFFLLLIRGGSLWQKRWWPQSTHHKEWRPLTRDPPWSHTGVGTPSQEPCTGENLSGHSARPTVTCTERNQSLRANQNINDVFTVRDSNRHNPLKLSYTHAQLYQLTCL